MHGDQHHVHAAFNDFLVGVEADETMRVVDGHLLGIHLLQPLAAVLESIGEDVGHGHQPDVLAGVHGLAAAPLPRPPQPIRPILIASLPAPWTPRANDNAPIGRRACPLPTRRRNCRRER